MMLTLHYRKLNHNNGLQTYSTDGLQTFIYAIYIHLLHQQVILTEMNEVKKDVGDQSGMIRRRGLCNHNCLSPSPNMSFKGHV